MSALRCCVPLGCCGWAAAGASETSRKVASWQALPAPMRWEVPPVAVAPGHSAVATFTVHLPDGVDVERGHARMTLPTVDGIGLSEPLWSPTDVVQHRGEAASRHVWREAFTAEVTVTVPVDAAVGHRGVQVETWVQGCAQGVCYAPQRDTVSVDVWVAPKPALDHGAEGR